ncbi:MAG: DnaD domain protein [Clostridia bacterium]
MAISDLILNTDDFCVLKGDLVDKILLSSNPDAALLYLYMSRAKKKFTPTNAMKHLNFSKERYDLAIYELTAMQVVKRQNDDKPKQSIGFTDKPKYTVAELRDARSDKRFSAVCDTCESVLGKALTEGYLKTLLYIYDRLKLPAEVIVELLMYLKSKTSTVPRRMDIEREAHLWIDMGIANHNDATNYIASKYAEKPVFDAMMKALKIYGRDPQPVEERYILHFINYGFAPDIVELAVNRMNDSIGKFSFQYLDKILLSFKEKNLFTIEEIIAHDPEFKKSDKNIQPNTARTGELADWEIELMKELSKE